MAEVEKSRCIGDSYQANADDLVDLRLLAGHLNRSKASLIREAIIDLLTEKYCDELKEARK